MSRFLIAVALVIVLALDASAAGWGHRAMVAASGIRPAAVGSYEGVGMSTRSADAAIRNACYWGRRVPVSIQTSQRNGQYYAVVRYR